MNAAQTLADLLALEELRRLKARYIYALDRCEHEVLRTLFLDGAVIEIDGTRFEVDGFIQMVRAAFRDHSAVHRIHAPLIDLLSDKDARGTWTITSVVTGPVMNVREAGYYYDAYRKVDGVGWLIASSRVEHTIVRQETDSPFPDEDRLDHRAERRAEHPRLRT